MSTTLDAVADPSATTFVPAEVLSQAGTMNKPQADLCGFGCVQIDDAGRVVLLNRYLSEMSGVSSKSAEGKNYFTAVNPCTNNPIFFGAFKRGVANDALDEQFDYVFTYQMRPTNVKVHLYRDPASKTNWIFVKKA
jgi:photoactive yellow protein